MELLAAAAEDATEELLTAAGRPATEGFCPVAGPPTAARGLEAEELLFGAIAAPLRGDRGGQGTRTRRLLIISNRQLGKKAARQAAVRVESSRTIQIGAGSDAVVDVLAAAAAHLHCS